jgi:hypothetical protein
MPEKYVFAIFSSLIGGLAITHPNPVSRTWERWYRFASKGDYEPDRYATFLRFQGVLFWIIAAIVALS